MAKPTEIFRGKAPIAMARMGEGIADAYARAGAIEGAGYQAFGEAIGGALKTAAGAYAGYKQQQSQVKAQEKAMDTFMPFLPKEMQQSIGAQREALNNDPNASLADKAAYYGQTMTIAGNAMAQGFQMQQINANQGAATGRTAMQEAGATARNQVNADVTSDVARMNLFGTSMNNPAMGALQRSTVLSGDDPVSIQLAPTGGGFYRRK